MTDTHFLTTVLRFEDGGTEGQILHVGDEESCERVADAIPAVTYSGNRKIKSAAVSVVPLSETEPVKVGERWRYE